MIEIQIAVKSNGLVSLTVLKYQFRRLTSCLCYILSTGTLSCLSNVFKRNLNKVTLRSRSEYYKSSISLDGLHILNSISYMIGNEWHKLKINVDNVHIIRKILKGSHMWPWLLRICQKSDHQLYPTISYPYLADYSKFLHSLFNFQSDVQHQYLPLY